MKALLMSMTMSLGFLTALSAYAQAPATAPAGSTGLCKDGTYYSGDTKKGACRGHEGVKEWYVAGAVAPVATNPDSAGPKTKSSRYASKTETASAASTSTPAAAPVSTTGLCKDGTYYSGNTKKGACRGHQGVKDWYGAKAGDAAAAPSKAVVPAPMTPPAASAPMPVPNRTPKSTATNPTASSTPAPGGGASQVWVNTDSKVYHCHNDRYYGKTKQGEYMSEHRLSTRAPLDGNPADHDDSRDLFPSFNHVRLRARLKRITASPRKSAMTISLELSVRSRLPVTPTTSSSPVDQRGVFQHTAKRRLNRSRPRRSGR